MTKPKQSIDHRVDNLLKHGIENPKKWAAVHDYEEPNLARLGGMAVSQWIEAYDTLRAHHLEETNFLFSMLGAMKDRILELQKENEELKKRQDDLYGPKIW